MALWNLATAARIVNPTDAQIQQGVDFRNAAATARPDLYGEPTYTLAQAKADIAGQQVAFYASGGVLRGYVIINVQLYPGLDGRAVAARIGDLVVDPALFNATTIRTVMDLLKAWMQAYDVSLLRLVGEVYDDSAFWSYAQARGYAVISAVDEPSALNPARKLLLIERRIVGTAG